MAGAVETFENIAAEEEHLVGILTAGDDKVCEECEEWAEGSPYEIEEVRDVYPLHPRCRCAVYPWEDLRFKGDAGFDPSEPREEHGKWTTGGGGVGGATHPGAGYSAKAYVDEKGTIHTSNVYDAQRALFENRHVELKQPKQVSTLIQRLGETAAEMEEHGEKAPVFNLCLVSIAGTNLFCAEHKGIPRVEMPVIRAKKTKEFVKYLKSKGYKIEKDIEQAANLRATQDQIDGAKVAASMARIRNEGFYKRIVVSKDDYILDGHHTWAGQLGVDAAAGNLFAKKSVKVFRVDIGIIQLIAEAEHYTGGAGKKAAGQDSFDPSEPRDPHGRWTGAHWFSRDPNDEYVYHGTDTEHLPGIKQEGLQAFLRNYFATDPKVAMQYGYRANLHHPSESRKRPGVLLRVHKQHVDPEAWKRHAGGREDFWTGPSDISVDKIEVRHGGAWKKLHEMDGVSEGFDDGFDDKYNPEQPRDPAGVSTGGQWTAVGGGGSYEFVSPNVEFGR